MEQESKRVAIIGAGASGCLCAYFLLKSGLKDVVLFESGKPLGKLLMTGGGRCNLAHAEFDFKTLASNYPRGEKFLYSVLSQFSTSDTIECFENIGVKTYIQEDGRIFPESNSAADVREKLLSAISESEIVREKVIRIEPISEGYKVITNKAEYFFSDVVISTGGGKEVKGINHSVIPFRPSLVGLNSDLKAPSGVVLKGVYSKDIGECGDILFTHYGISGPLVYKISSLFARKEIPYDLIFDFYPEEVNLQKMFDENSHKDLKNVLSSLFPQRFSEWICGEYSDCKAHTINGKIRDMLYEKIHSYKLKITGTNTGEETVTSGGYDLKEINSKNMESKLYPHLFFTGEVLDIDGFCGGFNLQNAWSTAYVAAKGIIN